VVTKHTRKLNDSNSPFYRKIWDRKIGERHEWASRARHEMDAPTLETASRNVVHEFARKVRSRASFFKHGWTQIPDKKKTDSQKVTKSIKGESSLAKRWWQKDEDSGFDAEGRGGAQRKISIG
jgi:hypothetical protein